MVQSTTTLQEARKSFTQEENYQLADLIVDLIRQMRERQDSGHSLIQISTSLHREADRLLDDAKVSTGGDQKIRCQAGCAHCCHIAVAITTAEAEELVAIVHKKGLVVDLERLTRQAQHNDETWLSQPVEDRRCVFLGTDNRCQVYEQRPFSCRKYFSTAAPELCNVERYPKMSIPIWFDIYTEALATAAMTHFGSDFLPAMILKALTQSKGANGVKS